jgi:hypothetical protein
MRAEEIAYLRSRIIDDFNHHFPEGASITELVSTFREHRITLEIERQHSNIAFDESTFSEIRKVIPIFQEIFNKPRSFIKSFEEKVHIDLVKKINYKAIAQLSRDSNDWQTQTLTSIKPKRVISEVNEDTYNIYENRFIITLIEKCYLLVLQERTRLENLIERMASEYSTSLFDDESSRNQFVRVDRSMLLNDILVNRFDDFDNAGEIKITQTLNEVKSAENKLLMLMRSDFFQSIRRSRRVANPINRTNILLFDHKYNRAFKLWEYLYLNKFSQIQTLNLEDTDSEEHAYCLYVFFCTLASIIDMGFQITSNPKVQINTNMIKLENEIRFERDKIILCIDIIKSNSIHLRNLIDEQRNIWNDFELVPKFNDFEHHTQNEIRDLTTKILNDMVYTPKKRERYSSKIALVSLDIHACSEKNDFGDALYRRFYNIGDNFDASESAENVKKWAGYKHGIQIISPTDIRLNILRISRLINFQLIKDKEFESFSEKCPICGSTFIKAVGSDYVCYECNHVISKTSCVNCKTQDILWIRYRSNRF